MGDCIFYDKDLSVFIVVWSVTFVCFDRVLFCIFFPHYPHFFRT